MSGSYWPSLSTLELLPYYTVSYSEILPSERGSNEVELSPRRTIEDLECQVSGHPRRWGPESEENMKTCFSFLSGREW